MQLHLHCSTAMSPLILHSSASVRHLPFLTSLHLMSRCFSGTFSVGVAPPALPVTSLTRKSDRYLAHSSYCCCASASWFTRNTTFRTPVPLCSRWFCTHTQNGIMNTLTLEHGLSALVCTDVFTLHSLHVG